MKISHGIEYGAVRLAAFIFRLLPCRMALSLGDRLGRGVNNLWRSRHLIVKKNLEIAFGEKFSEIEREELSRCIFGNIGQTLAEICRFPKIENDRLFERVSSEGEETFAELLKYGKGGLLIGSHFGNWELMGGYINQIGYPVDFLIRGQHNRKVDDYLTYLRQCLGVRVIHSEGRGGGMKEVLRALKNNRQVAIVSDQHAGSGGILVKFFGRLVSVPRAGATLSVKTGAPIVTGYILRKENGRHHCVFDKPIYPDLEADFDTEIFRLTQLFTARIEAAIRKYPEMWLWTHRRFKKVAGGDLTEGAYVD